jgi:hypothetical protein
MANFKVISDHQKAAERFISEVGSNTVRCYDIESFQSDIIPSVYPAAYLQNCTSMTVAVSGSEGEGFDPNISPFLRWVRFPGGVGGFWGRQADGPVF